MFLSCKQVTNIGVHYIIAETSVGRILIATSLCSLASPNMHIFKQLLPTISRLNGAKKYFQGKSKFPLLVIFYDNCNRNNLIKYDSQTHSDYRNSKPLYVSLVGLTNSCQSTKFLSDFRSKDMMYSMQIMLEFPV